MLDNSERANKRNNIQIAKEGIIYRCPVSCPIGRHCFVIKVQNAFPVSFTVLQKCEAKHEDIKITIGGENA